MKVLALIWHKYVLHIQKTSLPFDYIIILLKNSLSIKILIIFKYCMHVFWGKPLELTITLTFWLVIEKIMMEKFLKKKMLLTIKVFMKDTKTVNDTRNHNDRFYCKDTQKSASIFYVVKTEKRCVTISSAAVNILFKVSIKLKVWFCGNCYKYLSRCLNIVLRHI